jgi:hypothetical protein
LLAERLDVSSAVGDVTADAELELADPEPEGSYMSTSELLPNVISGRGRFNLFSALHSAPSILPSLSLPRNLSNYVPKRQTHASISWPFRIGRFVATILHGPMRIVEVYRPFCKL